MRAVSGFYERAARSAGLPRPRAGAVAFVQRFDSGLRRNLHFHVLWLDGVYAWEPGRAPVFAEHAELTDGDVAKLVRVVRDRVRRCLRRLGKWVDEADAADGGDASDGGELLPELAAAAVQWRAALGERAGHRDARVGRDGRSEPFALVKAPLCAECHGFSLHAAVVVAARDRERRIQRRIQEARFPILKTLDTFDFAAQPSLDRESIAELFQCGFVEKAGNVVLVGPVGAGKTHLAIALGIACCQRERRVRYITAAELTNALVEAKQDGRLSRKLELFARFDVVVLDELGYVPFDKQGADLLFGFITRVYERRSLIVTTNLAFASWSEDFLDASAAAAVMDRVVHHATVLKTDGDSFRLKAAKARAGRGRGAQDK